MAINEDVTCKVHVKVGFGAADAMCRTAAVYYGNMSDDTAIYHLKRAKESLVEAIASLDEALASDETPSVKAA